MLSIFHVKPSLQQASKLKTLISIEGTSENSKSAPQKNEISDVSWSLLNGRSFHLIGSCGTQGIFIHALKMKYNSLNVPSVEIFNSFSLKNTFSNPCRASWNYMVITNFFIHLIKFVMHIYFIF